MYFPVSGIEINPLAPLLVAFVISSVTSSAGVSGAFLLLPFQVSVLGFTSPSVTPTNLIYNIIAVPGGLYRYIKEGRMAWHLAWLLALGTLPGVCAGAWIRVKYLPDPRTFKFFVGMVLLCLGVRLISQAVDRSCKGPGCLGNKLKEGVPSTEAGKAAKITSLLPPGVTVKIKCFTLNRVEYEFWDQIYSVRTVTIFLLALVVGLIGGIYGIGGGAIIAPLCVSLLGLPVYIIAGATLAVSFFSSAAGIAFFYLLALTPAGGQASLTPDWMLGILFGAGGFLGTYLGARAQKFLPEKLIRAVLGFIVTLLAFQYVIQYFL